MKILKIFVVCVLLTGCCVFSGCNEQYADRVYVHFFTVPVLFSDGTSTEDTVSGLKEYLLELAGGYSELGTSEGGWVDSQGSAETEGIVSFIVSAPTDISAELKGYLSDNFNQQYPYVLVWTGTSD